MGASGLGVGGAYKNHAAHRRLGSRDEGDDQAAHRVAHEDNIRGVRGVRGGEGNDLCVLRSSGGGIGDRQVDGEGAAAPPPQLRGKEIKGPRTLLAAVDEDKGGAHAWSMSRGEE